jgi:hypothetical protein
MTYVRGMKRILSLFFLFNILASWTNAQHNLESSYDANEIKPQIWNPVNVTRQQMLREQTNWKLYLAGHPGWHVHFNEASSMPHRAYGPGLAQSPNDWLMEVKELFSIKGELVFIGQFTQGKRTTYRWKQTFNGKDVLFSDIQCVVKNNKIVSWTLEVFSFEDLATLNALSSAELINAAKANLEMNDVLVVSNGDLKIYPEYSKGIFRMHWVQSFDVKGENEIGIPMRYKTYVDAQSGKVLYRINEVRHFSNETKPQPQPMPFVVTAQMQATYYATSPWDPTVSGILPNLRVTVAGNDYYTDANGDVVIPQAGPVNATFSLEGPWAKVFTGTTTPSFVATLQDGSNTITFDNDANVKERTAYRSVQSIHDHVKFWMPNFTGMDFQLPTNIDVTGGDCNAFYDGTSINFYDLANGCNASSNIPDVAYHEYGHGVNDNYYQSQGGSFINGAMGEGYADFWAISLTQNPILGSGFYVANQDPIRRYDIDPKVYPMDLVGEVHSDGEIIMGAWYDTHLLLGSNWDITIPLFVDAYAGLQAQAMDGSEGQAYTDVLIDALIADDDDGDITNGTPNGNAIVQGFYMHGITLISNATIVHGNTPFVDSNVPVALEAGLDLTFPYLNYLQSVKLHYQINGQGWQEVDMNDLGSQQYNFDLGALPLATVVQYYFTASDIFNNIGTANPFGAHLTVYPNLPHVTLVGVSQMKLQDCDNNENWGAWTLGVSGDNATTGIWDLAQPISSVTVDAAPGTIVQTGTQTTEGGEYCFITGNALPTDGIGVNDVDGGKTTLQSPVIDMSTYTHPIIAYNRWYTNSPPGGANPGADWFQVQISNDNGATWTYIENTSTSDMSWRTNAFRVEDVIAPTAQMKFRFIASDSTHADLNLSGGSLVEAAMDDFILYDEFDPNISVSEMKNTFEIFPNPGHDYVVLKSNSNIGRLQVWNASGQMVYNVLLNQNGAIVPTANWASGIYQIRLSDGRSYRWMKQ